MAKSGTFKRILSYAKPYGKYWPTYLFLSVLSVIFGIANYALLGPLLTVLFEADTIQSVAQRPEFSLSVSYFEEIFNYYLSSLIVDKGVLKGLIFVCIVLILASLFSNLCRYFSQRILVTLKTRLMRNLRSDLYTKIASLNVGYFNNKRKGDILSSISNDVNEVQNSVASSFHIIFREPILAFGFLAMLFYMSPKLTAVSLVALPLSGLVIGKLTRKLKRGAVQTQQIMGSILSRFEESISGARIIKAFNAKKYVKESFEKDNDAHRRISRSIFNRQELASPLSEFLGITVAVVVLFYGGWLNIKGELGMSWPSFVVYIGFYWRVLEPLKAIANAYSNIQRGLVSGDRIFAILDQENPIKDSDNPLKINEFKDSIEFKNVNFAYNTDLVLSDIDIVIPKGKMVAIVGPSGSGKSTLADLLPRFYDVTSGSIKIDGRDVREYAQEDLISLMGIVTQETILFNDTVYNNIVFGMENVAEEDVVSAAKVANAHSFICEMEDQYQTNIGDRGVKLSGGERQRIAIARAVLKNPPILILDEATSALDTESEKLVQDALFNLMKNRTSLVIAHRLSTIRNADEIIVLKDGKIVERGTHDKLLQQNGLYSRMCQMQ